MADIEATDQTAQDSAEAEASEKLNSILEKVEALGKTSDGQAVRTAMLAWAEKKELSIPKGTDQLPLDSLLQAIIQAREESVNTNPLIAKEPLKN